MQHAIWHYFVPLSTDGLATEVATTVFPHWKCVPQFPAGDFCGGNEGMNVVYKKMQYVKRKSLLVEWAASPSFLGKGVIGKYNTQAFCY